VLAVPVKVCTKCGEAKSFESFHKDKNKKDGRFSWCKSCVSDNTRKWYEANRAKAIDKAKAWYSDHKEYRAEYSKIYRETNRTHLTHYKLSRIEHRRQLYAQQPEKYRAHSHNRRARKHNAGGSYTVADIAAIRAAQTDKQGRLICWACNKPIVGKPHLDHWIPLGKGGTNDPGNLHYMHAKCNLSKSAKHPTEIGRLL
jgi:hypothetical protein